MINPYYEEEQMAEMSGWVAMFRTEYDLPYSQDVCPLIHEEMCFLHEGRRMVSELHSDDLPELLYKLDGCFALEFE